MSRNAPPVILQRSLIDGDWVELDPTGRTLHDPNTAEFRQERLETPAEHVERALAAAHALDTSLELERVPLRERVALMLAVAEELDRRQEEIALQDSINMGAPLSTTRIIAGALGDRVRAAAADALELGEAEELGEADRPVRILRKPLGTALIIAPWNAPTFTVSGKLAAAVLAGCPVILKPSENAPSGCQLLSEIIQAEVQRRGLPRATFQLVHGSSRIGALLTGDPRIAALVFTGGTSAGRIVASAAAASLAVVQMELGSNNPVIVREDADVQQAAASIVDGMTRLNGQWCEAPGKILVHHSVHDELVVALREQLQRLTVGDALHPDTAVGPMMSEAHRDGLRREIERLVSLGGTVWSTERMPALDGWFLAPSIVTGVDPEAATEELFGPVVTVHAVADDHEALRHANSAGGGLDAIVFGRDHEAALELAGQIRAGEVRVNGTFMSDLADHSRQSFWGTSGIGGHGPQYGVRFFTGDRVVGVDRTDLPL